MHDHAGVVTTDGEATARAIERDYRMTGPFQWAREILRNIIEAGGTRAVFGPHEAFAQMGVWRMQVADDGCGMDEDELYAFFRTYGGSGKAVGGEHENMGIGAKTSLLPWNPLGMVIISVKDGVSAMIHIRKDAEQGHYLLQEFELEDGSTTYTPDPDFYDEEFKVTWADSIPDWLDEHGTVVVLLGSQEAPDTYVGNPSRSEIEWGSQSALSKYLAQKFWVLDGLTVTVVEPHISKIREFDLDNLWTRRVRGLGDHVQFANGFTATKGGRRELPSTVESQGTVTLDDGTEVDWFVHVEGVRTKSTREQPAAAGLVCVEHRGEVFNIRDHVLHLRQFGLVSKSARQRVTLVVRPLDAGDQARRGVYMTTDRSRLLVRGGGNAGQDLPMAEWGFEFAGKLPDEILALRENDRPAVSHREAVKYLIERFGWRWFKGSGPAGAKTGADDLRTAQKGRKSSLVRKPRQRKPRVEGEAVRKHKSPEPSTDKPAEINRIGRVLSDPTGGASPDWEWMDLDERTAGSWDPVAQMLTLDRTFGPAQEHVAYWQGRYPHVDGVDVRGHVEDTLGEIMLARVLHATTLKGFTPQALTDEILTPSAITLAMCGILAEEAVIAPRVGGKLGKAAA